jgi:hypothetical protein
MKIGPAESNPCISVVTFEPLPEISSDCHERDVGIQALGAYAVYTITNDRYGNTLHLTDDVINAGLLQLKLRDTQHRREDDQLGLMPVNLKFSRLGLNVLGEGLLELSRGLLSTLKGLEGSGDFSLAGKHITQAQIAKKMRITVQTHQNTIGPNKPIF